MKIHIETLLQRLEDLDKKDRKDLQILEHRVSELLRDKKRMEELLAIREAEIHKVKEESGHALRLLEQAKF